MTEPLDLRILEAVSRGAGNYKALAEAIPDKSSSTLRRAVKNLVAHGWLTETEDEFYRIFAIITLGEKAKLLYVRELRAMQADLKRVKAGANDLLFEFDAAMAVAEAGGGAPAPPKTL